MSIFINTNDYYKYPTELILCSKNKAMIRKLKKLEQLANRLHQNLHSKYSQGNQSVNFPKPESIKDVFHEKAYLASGWMSIIENPIHPIRKISLKNQLKDFLDEDKLASNDSKLQFLKHIDGGVKFDPSVFSQQRVQLGAYKNRITFHPTHTVTGNIFRQINQERETQLIVGHFGISKTFSVCFYQKLANYIIDYRMNTNPQEMCKSIKRVKKMFYWSIDKDHFTKQWVDELIQRQFLASQISYLTKHNYKAQEVWKDLHLLYNGIGIETLFIIDNINGLYSLVRQTGYTMKQRGSENPKFNVLKSMQNIIVQKFSQFDQVNYLSSMCIERQLLKQIQLMPETTEMKDIKVVDVYFQKELKQDQAKIELIDFFIEAYDNHSQSCVDKLISDQTDCIFKNRRQFYQHLREQIFNIWKDNEDFYINQYVIQRCIKQLNYFRSDFGFKQKIETTMAIQKRLIQFFSQMIEYKMPEILNAQVEGFLKESEHSNKIKLDLMKEIYKKVQELQNQGKPMPAQIRIKINQLKNVKNNEDDNLINFLERHLFAVENDEIVLLIPPKVFLKLKIGRDNSNSKDKMKKLVVEQIAKFFNSNLEKISNDQSRQANLQNIMRIILTCGNSSFSIMDNQSKNVIKEFKSIEKQTGGFNVLQSTKKFDFLKNIHQYLTFIIEKSTKQNKLEVNQIFLPVIKGTQVSKDHTYKSMKQSIHETNNSIVFIIINYDGTKEKFSINAFDVTVEKGFRAIGQKVQKFLSEFKNFENNNKTQVAIGKKNYKVEFNYYTMTPETNFDNVFDHLDVILKQYQDFDFKKNANDRVSYIRTSANLNNLLHQIGHLSLSKNMKITNQESSTSIDFAIYHDLTKRVCE